MDSKTTQGPEELLLPLLNKEELFGITVKGFKDSACN